MRPLSAGLSPHDCARHGHAERSTHWGLSCLYCGLPLPERPERIDGQGASRFDSAAARPEEASNNDTPTRYAATARAARFRRSSAACAPKRRSGSPVRRLSTNCHAWRRPALFVSSILKTIRRAEPDLQGAFRRFAFFGLANPHVQGTTSRNVRIKWNSWKNEKY